MRGTSARSAALAFGLLLLGCGTTAPRPDPPDPVDLAQQREVRLRQARDQVVAGNELFKAGRFAEAAAEFEAAYQIIKRPELQYNVARCWERAGDRARAIAAFNKLLASAGEEPSSRPVVKMARKGLERLQAQVEPDAGAASSPAAPAAPPLPQPPPAPFHRLPYTCSVPPGGKPPSHLSRRGDYPQTMQGQDDSFCHPTPDHMRYAAAFSPDGKLVVASGDKRLAAWSVPGGKLAWAADLDGVRGRLLQFSPDGRTLLVGTDGGAVYLVDTAGGRTLRTLGRLKGWVSSGAFSPDGKLVVAVDYDGGLGCWRAASGREVQLPTLPKAGRLELVMFSPDGAHLVIGGRQQGGDGAVDLTVVGLRDQQVRTRRPQGNLESAMGASFTADGRLMAVGFWRGRLELLRFPELETVWSQQLPDWVLAVRFVDQDERLLAAGPKGIDLRRTADGEGYRVFDAPEPNWIIDAFDLTATEDRMLVVRRGFRRVQVLRYPLAGGPGQR